MRTYTIGQNFKKKKNCLESLHDKEEFWVYDLEEVRTREMSPASRPPRHVSAELLADSWDQQNKNPKLGLANEGSVFLVIPRPWVWDPEAPSPGERFDSE